MVSLAVPPGGGDGNKLDYRRIRWGDINVSSIVDESDIFKFVVCRKSDRGKSRIRVAHRTTYHARVAGFLEEYTMVSYSGELHKVIPHVLLDQALVHIPQLKEYLYRARPPCSVVDFGMCCIIKG